MLGACLLLLTSSARSAHAPISPGPNILYSKSDGVSALIKYVPGSHQLPSPSPSVRFSGFVSLVKFSW